MAENPPSKNIKKTKKVWKIKTKNKTIEIPVKEVVEIVIFIVVLFTVTFGTFWILQASLKTKTPMVVVISESMVPTLNVGDLLFVKGVGDPEEIVVGDHDDRTGDIIVFTATWSTDRIPVVHRVVNSRFNTTGEEILEFQTYGDNNNGPDQPPHPWVREDDVIGIVVGRIPYVGLVKIWLSKTGLAIPIIIILVLCLTVSIAWDLTHPDKEEEEKKKSKRKLFKRSKEPEEPEKPDENSSIDLGV